MATELYRIVICIVSGYLALLLVVAAVPVLLNPSAGDPTTPDLEPQAGEPVAFDHYFIEDVSLRSLTETGMQVHLHADRIIHRNRTLLGQIDLESLDEIFIDQLELDVAIPEREVANDPHSSLDMPVSVIMDSFSGEFAQVDDSLSETLTRVVVDKFSATFTFPQLTQLWIQSGEARLYEGLAIFEGGVSVTNSQGSHFAAGTVVWDKHAGGFLMPFGYHNDSGDSTEAMFISLGKDGSLLATDYLPACNWESVDIIDQMSQRYSARLTGSMAMFFLTAGNQ